MRNFGAGRMYYPSPRFSQTQVYSPSAAGFHRSYVANSRASAPVNSRPAILAAAITSHSSRTRDNRTNVNGSRNGIGASQARNNTNNLRPNWRSHVLAQHSASWHRDWDRGHDHWWHGHHCRFINGSWVIFDAGFDPWWPYGYPYGYYAYDGYPYDYGSDDYDQGVYQDEGYNQRYLRIERSKRRLDSCGSAAAVRETWVLPGRNRWRFRSGNPQRPDALPK